MIYVCICETCGSFINVVFVVLTTVDIGVGTLGNYLMVDTYATLMFLEIALKSVYYI